MTNEEKREEYWYSRLKWARTREEPILAGFKEVGQKAGLDLDAEMLEALRRRCIEELKFSYPADHELAAMIAAQSEGVDKSDVFPYAYEMFKKLRVEHEAFRKAF